MSKKGQSVPTAVELIIVLELQGKVMLQIYCERA